MSERGSDPRGGLEPVADPQDIAVVGGGMAGMLAAQEKKWTITDFYAGEGTLAFAKHPGRKDYHGPVQSCTQTWASMTSGRCGSPLGARTNTQFHIPGG